MTSKSRYKDRSDLDYLYTFMSNDIYDSLFLLVFPCYFSKFYEETYFVHDSLVFLDIVGKVIHHPLKLCASLIQTALELLVSSSYKRRALLVQGRRTILQGVNLN